jgi:ubiquinone/menaquinone biosynthesis C-methylase UbiE
MGAVVKSWTVHESAEYRFGRALDIGTGTGKSLAILEGAAESVVGLEQNPALLTIAKENAGPNTRLVQGSADRLPFEDASFDLIASQGLRAALDKRSTAEFLKELSRVLAPNGTYLEGHYYSDEDGNPHPDLARFTETSKAMLTDMIGDSVSGAFARADRLGVEDEQDLLDELGLHQQYYDVLGEDGESHTLISVITKTSDTAAM